MTTKKSLSGTDELRGSGLTGAPLFRNPVMAPNDRINGKPRPVVSTTEARSGVIGHNVRYVLIFGLAAVIVAFGIIFYVFFR